MTTLYTTSWRDETSNETFTLHGTLQDCLAGFYALKGSDKVVWCEVKSPSESMIERYERGANLFETPFDLKYDPLPEVN